MSCDACLLWELRTAILQFARFSGNPAYINLGQTIILRCD